jgi:acetyl esterase/lipase
VPATLCLRNYKGLAVGNTMTNTRISNVSVQSEKTDASNLLDPQTRVVVEMLERDPFLDPEMAPPQMRKAFDEFYAKIEFPALDVANVNNIDVPGDTGPIAIRVYKPQSANDLPKPILVFIHGGAMMMGSLDSYDSLCRRLANKSDCIIVSTSYRLSPEHKFPCAVEDVLTVFKWAHKNAASLGGDQERLAIGGESGGGYLAAVVTQLLRDDANISIAFQLLINPAIGRRANSKSMEKYATGFFFEPEALDWIYSQYLNDMSELSDPMVSPILASSFENLPPAFIVVAGCDILRDDIELYAQLLKEAGVSVETSTYENTIHGFTVMGGAIDAGVRAIDESAAKLRIALADK